VQVPVTGTDGVTRSLDEAHAFREADSCWSHIGYISMLKYAVRRASEVFVDVGRSGTWERAQETGRYERDHWEYFRIWDSSVNLNLDTLAPLVQEALGSVSMWESRQ
jgi:hypothetical protein